MNNISHIYIYLSFIVMRLQNVILSIPILQYKKNLYHIRITARFTKASRAFEEEPATKQTLIVQSSAK